MNRYCRSVLALALLGLGSAAAAPRMAQAQAESSEHPLDAIAWMAGHWRGPMFGGEGEELWLAPRAGTMVGVFRLDGDGQTRVIELLSIVAENGELVYRFKHFDPDYTAWEDEPLTYRLTELGERSAVFEMAEKIPGKPQRLSYRRRDERHLIIGIDGNGILMTRVEPTSTSD